MTTVLSTWLGHGIRALALLWLVVHFSLTLAYVLPMNPAKASIEPTLQKTIGRFFSQNWSLFAPDPVSSNLSMSAVCMTPDEAASALNGEFPEHRWVDLSTPLWHRFQQSRFSAYDRLARPITAWLRTYSGGSAKTQQQARACRKGHQRSCEAYEANISVERDVAARRLANVGGAYCRDIDPSGTWTAVGIALTERNAVPWSQRETGEATGRFEPIGVYVINRELATAGIYTQGSN